MADTGVGIQESQRVRSFNLCFSMKADGYGLGLAMTYLTVKLHGGTIDLESGPGKGTRFFVSIPMAGNANGARRAIRTDPLLALRHE